MRCPGFHRVAARPLAHGVVQEKVRLKRQPYIVRHIEHGMPEDPRVRPAHIWRPGKHRPVIVLRETRA